VPQFNTHPDALESLARQKLSQNGWLYASSNAGLSHTHLANRQAFFRHKLVPRQLIDTNERSTRTTLRVGGKKWEVSAPFGMAPVGINKIYHDRGELAVAKVAGELGLMYGLSTGGSYPIEDVGRANDEGRANRTEANKNLGDGNEHKVPEAPRVFQLYMPHDDELTISLLKRAHEAGFEACILTTDTPQLGWRHDDVATSNYAFYRGIGGELGFTDPVFQKRMKAEGVDPTKDPVRAATMWIDTIWHGRAWSWEKAVWARQKWQEIAGKESPFLIKGIQSAADAKKAADLGFEGVVVSNHAGRQVDGAVGSLDALENVVKAVGEREGFTVMFDSGVRGAADVMKALALGARFVFIGRLWIWGLAIMGEEGVRHVMRGLLADFDILLNVMGVNSVKEIDGSLLESGPRVYGLLNEKSKL
jgi:isopentenyl diphosphate isomerase/L-lactate dehydrogenase-like FMN-dependent dehydrogenase